MPLHRFSITEAAAPLRCPGGIHWDVTESRRGQSLAIATDRRAVGDIRPIQTTNVTRGKPDQQSQRPVKVLETLFIRHPPRQLLLSTLDRVTCRSLRELERASDNHVAKCRIGFRTRASHLRVRFRRHERFRPPQGDNRTVVATVLLPSHRWPFVALVKDPKGTCRPTLVVRHKDRLQMTARGAASRPPANGHMY